MRVGIIGGTGKMGQLFKGVFERGGYEVVCSGRHTSVTARQIASTCDIVMVAVPIRATVGVIEEVAPLVGPTQLFCDLTSIKVEPINAMLKSQAQVAGFHPMFGPTISSLQKQTIIVTPVRCKKEMLDPMLDLFRREGAVITETTPGEHDRMMAVVQGLMHFVTLSMAETMRRMGITPGQTLPYMSPVYRIEMGLIGRLLAQDASLYGDILGMNPYVGEVLQACEASVHDLRGHVASGDVEGFIRTFQLNTHHFGHYCAQGMEETDTLINTVVQR